MCLTPKGDGASLGHPPAAGGTLEENHCGSSRAGRFLQLLSRGVAIIYKVIISSSAACVHCFSKKHFDKSFISIKSVLYNIIIISGKGKASQGTEGCDQLYKNAPFPSTASPSLQHFQLKEGQSPAMFPRHAGGGGIIQRKLQSRRTLQIQIQIAGQ